MIKRSRGKAKKEQALNYGADFMDAFRELAQEKGIAPSICGYRTISCASMPDTTRE